MIPMLDLRGERVARRPKIKVVGKQPVWRDPKLITGIVIHQTAAEYQLDKRGVMLRAAGGDYRLALGRRALNVACHAMAFRDGFFVAATPLRWHVNHGNGLNAHTLGLEIEGRYAGLRDDPTTMPRREDLETTWGGKPTPLTAVTVDAARAALRWLVEQGRAEGMPIEDVYAHRQSNGNRRSDPGQELWERVVEEYAIPVLGLRARYEVALGTGRPIPREWSSRGIGRY